MATATPTDVENRLGRLLESDETTLAATLLEDIELVISQKVSIADANPDVLVMVEARAVARILRNPDGLKHQQADGYAYTMDAQVASGRLKLLDDEWALLGVQRRYASIPMKFRSREA